jgi:hypothetical protein
MEATQFPHPLFDFFVVGCWLMLLLIDLSVLHFTVYPRWVIDRSSAGVSYLLGEKYAFRAHVAVHNASMPMEECKSLGQLEQPQLRLI